MRIRDLTFRQLMVALFTYNSKMYLAEFLPYSSAALSPTIFLSQIPVDFVQNWLSRQISSFSSSIWTRHNFSLQSLQYCQIFRWYRLFYVASSMHSEICIRSFFRVALLPSTTWAKKCRCDKFARVDGFAVLLPPGKSRVFKVQDVTLGL